MHQQEIPKAQEHWVDNAFRWLRHHGNLEVSITVLVTAEIFAAVYYRALQNATNSGCLQAICKRILHDEDLHIRFQSYALNRIQRKRNRLLNAYMWFNHTLLLLGTIPIVWYYHKRVFVAGRYNFLMFCGEVLRGYEKLRSIVRAGDRQILQMEQVY